MNEPLLDYLNTLKEIEHSLSQLTDLAKEKTEAVCRDDLVGLSEVLKREQAVSLTLRGQEQKRVRLAESLSFQSLPLRETAARYPHDLYLQAKDTVEDLTRQYEVYHCAAQVARNTLECNLHEIEKVLEQVGGRVSAGVGYGSPEVAPPAVMKTDFRA